MGCLPCRVRKHRPPSKTLDDLLIASYGTPSNAQEGLELIKQLRQLHERELILQVCVTSCSCIQEVHKCVVVACLSPVYQHQQHRCLSSKEQPLLPGLQHADMPLSASTTFGHAQPGHHAMLFFLSLRCIIVSAAAHYICWQRESQRRRSSPGRSHPTDPGGH